MRILNRLGAAFARLRIGQQLAVAFASVLVLAATMGAAAVIGLAQVDREAGALNHKWLQIGRAHV